MKYLSDENIKRNIFTYSLSGIIIVAFSLLLFNISSVKEFLSNLIGVLSPFIWGIIFAFIMSKFANWFETKLPDKLSFKTKRFISSFVAVFLLIAIIIVVILIILPQLGESVSKLSSIIVNFTTNAPSWIKSFSNSLKLPSNVATSVYDFSNNLISSIWNFLKTNIPNLVNFTISTVSGLFNFVIGFVVALYLLIDREKIVESFRNFFKAFLSKESYEKLTIIYNVSIASFYRFFQGKLLDSLIIGILCFIGMIILKLDFAVLISFIVCITNIIPFFGPFIGAIPSVLILLMVDPTQAFVFAIFILVLQQIDGNIIGPKILGDSVGLSSLWIMFAILIGGAYFGFAGMLLGVPIFSVIHYLVKEEIDKRLNKKKPTKKTKFN